MKKFVKYALCILLACLILNTLCFASSEAISTNDSDNLNQVENKVINVENNLSNISETNNVENKIISEVRQYEDNTVNVNEDNINESQELYSDLSVVKKINGIWRMVINGVVDYNYTGIGTNENGTWLLENGKVTFKYTGNYTATDGKTYIVENSQVRTDLTAVMKINNIWRMVINGVIDYNYTGIGTNENGTWYLENGKVTFNYRGTYTEGTKAYIIEGSKVYVVVTTSTTEVIKINDIWRMVKNGVVDYNYTGIGTNNKGTWLLENGKVTFKYTGNYTATDGKTYIIEKSEVKTNLTTVMKINNIWRMVKNGVVDYNYTGIGTNENGTWYLENGKVTFNYKGTYAEGTTAYIIEGSQVYATVTTTTTEVKKINNIWRMVINGVVDYNYTGIGTNDKGTWLLEKGTVTFKYTGNYTDTAGKTYIIEKSQVRTDLTTVMKINNIWRMVKNGAVDYNYTGIGTNENGTWYLENGKVTFNYKGTYAEGTTAYIIEGSKVYGVVTTSTTEVIKINDIWRMVKNGVVDYNYTGIGTNKNGTWYLENGVVTFSYSGIEKVNYTIYYFKASKAIGIETVDSNDELTNLDKLYYYIKWSDNTFINYNSVIYPDEHLSSFLRKDYKNIQNFFAINDNDKIFTAEDNYKAAGYSGYTGTYISYNSKEDSFKICWYRRTMVFMILGYSEYMEITIPYHESEQNYKFNYKLIEDDNTNFLDVTGLIDYKNYKGNYEYTYDILTNNISNIDEETINYYINSNIASALSGVNKIFENAKTGISLSDLGFINYTE